MHRHCTQVASAEVECRTQKCQSAGRHRRQRRRWGFGKSEYLLPETSPLMEKEWSESQRTFGNSLTTLSDCDRPDPPVGVLTNDLHRRQYFARSLASTSLYRIAHLTGTELP